MRVKPVIAARRSATKLLQFLPEVLESSPSTDFATFEKWVSSQEEEEKQVAALTPAPAIGAK
jgi:hypothetical protein